ncbi:MAG: PAS domain-containing protein, partial [Hyphomicrobiaceae bacterium]|nr:PAS domain-containing protein [Hyphomicrobiaceae bacterium]
MTRTPMSTRRHVQHDLLLSALPHPILLISDEGRILYANSAAESFLSASQAVLKRQTVEELVSFGSPLLALIDQVRRSGISVNEYGVDLGSPRIGAQRLVDIFAGPLTEQPELIVVMLQQRSMAQMIERQLTHRAAARSVSGLAAVLAHEIKNPLS